MAPLAPSAPAPAPQRVLVLMRGESTYGEDEPTLSELTPKYAFERMQATTNERALLPNLKMNRLLRSVTAKRLEALHKQTLSSRRRQPFGRIHPGNLRIVTAPDGMPPYRLAALLRRIPEVAHAYVEPCFSRPCTEQCDPLDDLSVGQSWLDLAPEGLSARYVWPLSGGKGQGVPFAIIDAGFNVDGTRQVCHCGLPPGIQLRFGSAGNRAAKQHGMAALGIVAARHDAGGILGLAPGAEPVHALSWTDASSVAEEVEGIEVAVSSALVDPWNALLSAIDLLAPEGTDDEDVRGVILLELEVEAPPEAVNANAPAESELCLRKLIAMATGRGLTVVEPAGNGGVALETTFLPGDLSGTVTSSLCGALIVGSADLDHRPLGTSNTSAIIDCFAQGEAVPSLGYQLNAPTTHTVRDFSGTSSASAIVAGAVLCAQGLALAARREVADPESLRARLREHGTPAKGAADEARTDVVGRLPNLASLAEALGFAPLYLRDFPDHGGGFHNHASSMSSPDLWVGPVEEEVPERFSTEGAEGEVSLVAGVRMRTRARLNNRGGEALPEVVLSLFLASATAASAPVALGQLAVADVAGNGAVSFSGDLEWEATDPLPEAPILLVLANAACFPLLDATSIPSDEAAFSSWVRRHPRVTFRRFTVG